MKPGRQWLVFDADFYDNSFAQALMGRFGWAGPALFVAFLCTCKRNLAQGKIRYRTEFEALEAMGVADLPLLDKDGQPFTLDQFWAFTGRYKQTSRTRQGQSIYVSATGWEQWQKSLNTGYERERKRRWRADSVRDNVPSENEIEKDIKNRGTSPGKATPKPEPPAYPEWAGEGQPDEPLIDIKDALGALPWRKNVDG